MKIVGRENIYEKIQECLEPTKIENIIRRFEEGDPTALGHESGIYADISDMPTNIIEAQKRIQDVQTSRKNSETTRPFSWQKSFQGKDCRN